MLLYVYVEGLVIDIRHIIPERSNGLLRILAFGYQSYDEAIRLHADGPCVSLYGIECFSDNVHKPKESVIASKLHKKLNILTPVYPFDSYMMPYAKECWLESHIGWFFK